VEGPCQHRLRKLASISEETGNRGIKIYCLNIGQRDISTLKSFLKALKSIDRTILVYSPSQGNLSLRKALVKYYNSFNIN